MNILVVSRERPLNEDEVVSGNAVRTHLITDVLSAAGHQVSMAWLSVSPPTEDSRKFRSADELQSLIFENSPDVILVTHWDLVTLLPYDLSIPVVLDMAIATPMEVLSVAGTVRAMRNALGRCDLIMIDDDAQKDRLVYTLIEAGLDIRNGLPVIVVKTESRDADQTATPLLDWLKNPRKAARLATTSSSRNERPVLAVPPLRVRIARQWKLVRQFILPLVLGLGRSARPTSGHGVIIVTRGDLFPPDHGAAVRTLETANALARNGSRVGLVTDNRSHWLEITPEGMTRHRVPWRIRLLSLPAPLVKILHHSKNLPHSNSFLYLPLSDGSWYWRILAANKHISANVLQAEFPAYAQPCLEAGKALACGVVLVEHNVEYQRLKEQVPELSDGEFENLRAIEIDLCRQSGAVVCVSDNDRRQLEAAGIDPGRLHTIPHGVDLSSGENLPEPGVRERFGIEADSPLLVYHGTYSYPPNREVLGIFANTILPGLEEAGLKCHLLAVGRDAPSAAPHERIHFTGSVPEVGPWLRAADIAVVPLTDGGGTRMKILDYFAAELPVISTRKGIEGIPASHAREALIIDEWPEFIEGIADTWENREKSAALAANGRAFAESLSWDEIAKRYMRVYSSLGR